MNKYNILFLSSEFSPLAKTGGLADVSGALPEFLIKRGHDVRVVIPFYSFIDLKGYEVQKVLNSCCVWMGNREEWCSVYRVMVGVVPVYLIDFKLYFDREGLYHDNSYNDYPDNPKRFAFFTRAALQLCKDTGFSPDIVHSNDWQTALAPAYLKVWDWNDKFLGRAASVLTIHNMGYQGVYPAGNLDYIGLGYHNFTSDKFEAYGAINYLKGGIVYSDAVNTVSRKYADETRYTDMGCGLSPYLNNKGSGYTGILNGVNYNKWNPETDTDIACNYSERDFVPKQINKKALQDRMLLNKNEKIAVIGIVTRFSDQKGLDLLKGTIESIVANMEVQFAILGSGDKVYEDYFRWLPSVYPGKIGSYIGYDDKLAHLIEAGADFFIMPSRYEPCGLNQIYSMRYGTLPIVRAVGGLDESVENYDEISGTGTGFKFYDYTSNALYYTVGWAVSTYYDRKPHMNNMIKVAMGKRFSWDTAAMQYEKLYEAAIQNKKLVSGGV